MKVIMTRPDMRMKTVCEKGGKGERNRKANIVSMESIRATEEYLSASEYRDFVFVVGLVSRRWEVVLQ